MIVPMTKIFVAVRATDREGLLETLRELEAVHLIPVDSESGPDEHAARETQQLENAVAVLRSVEPAGEAPAISPPDAAREAVGIARREAEHKNRLNTLYREIDQIALWGDTRSKQMDRLREAGIEPRFYSIENADAGAIEGECVEILGRLDKKHVLVGVISPGTADQLPESASEIPRPERDRPSIRHEAAEIDEALKSDEKRLACLARLLPDIEDEAARARSSMEFTAARNGGTEEGTLYAVQGWIPADNVARITEKLAEAGIPAAAEEREPDEEERPPTLIRHPRWVAPIQALFDILGTKPGYREYDLSPFFMVAMPLFTAMLVGDAGYGLLFVLAGLLFYRKLKNMAGAEAPQLIITFGAATMVWGILTANWFGVSPDKFADDSILRTIEASMGLLWRPDDNAARNLVMQVCFIIACIHLVLAHLRRAVDFLPSQQGVAELGWCSFLVGMFAVVWVMLFKEPVLPMNLMFALLGAGGGLVVLFSYPKKNPVKRIGLGIMGNLMDMIGTFSDTMSYIRLMAVGLASYYIASAFNGLAGQIASVSPLLIVVAVIILVAAHTLNIILCLIAIFAHGVRLNMLEFSNNAGVQWAGYPFTPFANHPVHNEGEV